MYYIIITNYDVIVFWQLIKTEEREYFFSYLIDILVNAIAFPIDIKT